MRSSPNIAIIIPALNEQESLRHLLPEIPKTATQVIVVDNGSTDDTARVATELGAKVIWEPTRGYGQACLTGIAAAKTADIIVFLDADYCDDLSKLGDLLGPILEGEADFTLGSRMHKAARASLTFPQRFGNGLACLLMKIFWHTTYTDLGPFRAITKSALTDLAMQDRNFGWTVEMQINAARKNLKIVEIDVPYRDRLYGKSKVSGTISGVFNAGNKILYIIAREVIRDIKRSRSKAPSLN